MASRERDRPSRSPEPVKREVNPAPEEVHRRAGVSQAQARPVKRGARRAPAEPLRLVGAQERLVVQREARPAQEEPRRAGVRQALVAATQGQRPLQPISSPVQMR